VIKAQILSVGDEIVSGQIVDSNAAYLSQRLGELGIPVVGHAAVRDDQGEIEAALRSSAGPADVVIVTGGLGPTHDDLTREAIAAVAGVDLVLDPPSLENIRTIFAAHGIEMPPSNEKQATYPVGGEVLPNATGTAAGVRALIDGADVFVLPGVPREMMAMFEATVVPRLKATDRVIVTRSLRCFGMSESLIAERLGAVVDLHGEPRVGILASGGVITVKFTTAAATQEAALEQLDPLCAKARSAIGAVVFGEDGDTLEQVVVRQLKERGYTIALAESCTGGLIAHCLTEVAGVSEVFREGLVTYSNEAKTRLLGVRAELFESVGAVSEEVARRMAEGVRSSAGADVGVGVTGIAGPSGGSAEKPVGTVHVAVAVAGRTEHRKLSLRGVRSLVKNRAAKHALNMVRLVLAGE